MIVLDASALIAHLNPSDTHHDVATSILLEAAQEPFLVHALTLAEVLVAGARTGRSAEMWADLLAAGVRLADRDDDEPLRLADLRAWAGVKLPDCCVLDAAMTNDASLATFDRALAMTSRRLGIVVIP